MYNSTTQRGLATVSCWAWTNIFCNKQEFNGTHKNHAVHELGRDSCHPLDGLNDNPTISSWGSVVVALCIQIGVPSEELNFKWTRRNNLEFPILPPIHINHANTSQNPYAALPQEISMNYHPEIHGKIPDFHVVTPCNHGNRPAHEGCCHVVATYIGMLFTSFGRVGREAQEDTAMWKNPQLIVCLV